MKDKRKIIPIHERDKNQIDVYIKHANTYIFRLKLKQILDPRYYFCLKKECGFNDETVFRIDAICHYQGTSCLIEFWYGIDTKWDFRKIAFTIKLENIGNDKMVVDTVQDYFEIVLESINWEEFGKYNKRH